MSTLVSRERLGISPVIATEMGSNRRWARLLKSLGNLVFGGVMLGFVVILLSLTVLPRLIGYQTYVVLTGSMAPTIPVGSVVIVVPTDPKTVRAGDVISFTRWDLGPDPVTITHRVARVESENSAFPIFITKGDANSVEDAQPVRYLGPAGKVVSWLPSIGHFFLFGRTNEGKSALLLGPGLLLAVAWVWTIWRPRRPEQPVVRDPAGDPAGTPDPVTPFRAEVVAQATALRNQPDLSIDEKRRALQQLTRRAERTGEAELVAWLDRLIGGLPAETEARPAFRPVSATAPPAPRSAHSGAAGPRPLPSTVR